MIPLRQAIQAYLDLRRSLGFKPVSYTHLDVYKRQHLKHLKLKGLQPKTIDAYARAIRRLGGYFDYRIEALTEAQLTEYFSDLIGTHSWSAVKLDLYLSLIHI